MQWDITVSCDGTWQKQGFSSKNGVLTVATVNGLNSKILDTETLTNHCSQCKITNKQNRPAHHCQKHFEGTAGSMEVEGVQRIFRRSQQKYGLTYTGYLGESDSKSFKNLKNAEPPIYPRKQIKKLEYGHIPKRMGETWTILSFSVKRKPTRMMMEGKWKELEENQIDPKGNLQNSRIFYGFYKEACWGWGRNEKTNKDNILSPIILCVASDVHGIQGTWQKLMSECYLGILNEMRSTFESLTSTELLSRCTHGGTQNVNETFHNIILSLCPREVFVCWRRLDISVCSALLQFNERSPVSLLYFPTLDCWLAITISNMQVWQDQKRVKRPQRTEKMQNRLWDLLILQND